MSSSIQIAVMRAGSQVWPPDSRSPTSGGRRGGRRAKVCPATVILSASWPGRLGIYVTVEETGDEIARLTFAVGETGVLVTGEQNAVSAYTAQLHRQVNGWGQPVTVSELADIGAAATALASFAVSSGAYVQLSQRSMELLRQHQMIPGQTAEFFQSAVRGAQGRFAGALELQPVSLDPARPPRCSWPPRLLPFASP